MRSVLHILTLFLIASAVHAAEFPEREQHEILETVFRHQLDTLKSHKHAKVFFLAVGQRHTDPPEMFMQRFAKHTPKVKSVSQSRRGDRGFVFDKESGEPGLILFAEPPLRTSDVQIIVHAGFFAGNLAGAESSYVLKKADGKWKVTGPSGETIIY